MRHQFLILFLASTFVSSAAQESAWKPALDKNGISIETRAVAGSAYKEFRAVMRVKTTLTRVASVMRDIPRYTAWMKDCKEARQIAQLSPQSGVVYALQSTPWPIAERDVVVKFTYQKSLRPPALSISLEAVPAAIPPHPGRVRIRQLRGYWRFWEISPGTIEIVYSMHSEPGGSLPAWAISGMIAHLPYETLSSLRRLLQE